MRQLAGLSLTSYKRRLFTMSQDLYQAFMVMINFAALVVAIIALVKK